MTNSLSELEPLGGAGTLHEQIAARLRHGISAGRFAPGTQLPTARQFAHELDVNVNTVLRAYRQLAADGLVDMRRGRGTLVRQRPDMARLYQLADDLLAEAARQGITRGELFGILTRRS